MFPRQTSSHCRARLAVALVLLCGLSSVAHAFYLINPLSYWPASSVAGNLVFQVGLVASPPNVPNPPLTDGSVSWDAAFVTQLNAWNAVLPDAVLNLQGVVGSVVVPAQNNDVNNVFFSGTVYGDTWGGSTVGICLSFWSDNLRTEADVLFNSTKTWNAYTGNLQGGTTDFRRVALHELGHALLLDHPDDVGQSVSAIMNSASSNTDALTADDIAGVTAVFGALTPITITVQPRQPTATPGGQIGFNVTAAGSEPITYQWQRSTNGGGIWTNLPGFDFANGSATGFNDGNLFRVVVTNPLGTVTSRAVMLIVTGGVTGPSFDIDPVSVTVNEAADVILAGHASGSPTPDYYWEMSSNGGSTWGPVFSSFGPADVSGAGLPPQNPNPYFPGSPILKITHAIAAISGFQFRAVATDGTTSVTSSAATVTVNGGGPAPYFLWQPLDVYAQAGANAMLVAGVSGSPTPTRQWQRSINGGGAWSNLANDATFSGVTLPTLTITSVTAGMSGHLFRLNATNGSGNATSRVVALSVGSAAAVPTVTSDPASVTLAAGQTATFSSLVTALPAPVFQWEMSTDGTTYSSLDDGLITLGTITLETIVSGANTRTLTVRNLDASLDTFRFRLVATNASGADTSAAATLTIGTGGTAPTITTQPANTTKLVGENATFTAAADGSPTPTLQWQRSTNGGGAWNDLTNDFTFSGVTTGTLTVTSVTVAMTSHQFRAVATNTVSSANSNAATLTVNQAPAITTQPANATKLVGETATFTAAAAAGTPTPTLQWQRSTNGGGAWANVPTGAPFSGETTGTLTITGVTLAMTGHQFRLVATNLVTSATSNAATLTVNLGPAITTHPSNASVLYLADPTFTVAASGTPTPTFQWQLSTNGGGAWNDITNNATYGGATTATLTVTNVTVAMSAHRFRAIATNAGGNVASNAAILTVGKATATVALSNLSRNYTGAPLSPTATTSPVGLTVGFTYNAVATTPTNAGTYALVATINDANYQGSSNGSFTILPALILGQPGPINTTAGGITTLSVTASSGGTPTYQWQVQPAGGGAFTDVAGATASSYSVPSAQRFHAGNYRVVVTVNGVAATSSTIVVNINAPAPSNARLLNLSTRGLAEAGANQLFPGFVVSGTGTKKLLIRAVGPSLGALVPSFTVIPDPRMELKRYNFATSAYEDITNNDDWQTNANAADIVTTSGALFAFPLTDAKDSALLVDLPAGQYAVVGGDKNGTSGIAIVELYDADVGNPTTRLINISNRGFCGVGDQVMIPGFVISSEGPKTLLVRVVGPTLGGFGVPGTMGDPKLTFYRTNPATGVNTELFAQDNWSDNPDSAYSAQIAVQVSAFPLTAGSNDAAFVVTLEPGVYTVIGSAADGVSTGVVLVEVYVVP